MGVYETRFEKLVWCYVGLLKKTKILFGAMSDRNIAHASLARRTEWYPRSFVAAHPDAIYCPTSHDGVELANNLEH